MARDEGTLREGFKGFCLLRSTFLIVTIVLSLTSEGSRQGVQRRTQKHPDVRTFFTVCVRVHMC